MRAAAAPVRRRPLADPPRAGADLACLVNEAALLAVRHGKSGVDAACLREALSRMQATQDTRSGANPVFRFMQSLS